MLYGPSGKALVHLIPRIKVAYRSARAQRLYRRRPPSPRTRLFSNLTVLKATGREWAAQAAARTGGIHYRLTLANRLGDPRISLLLERTYSRNLMIHQEVLTFQVAAASRALLLDRAYGLTEVKHPMVIGQLTPHLALFEGPGAQFAFLGRSGIQGIKLHPARGAGYSLDMEIDHQENHPFSIHSRCVSVPEPEMTRLPMNEMVRSAGQKFTSRADWIVGKMVPLFPGRFPRAYRSALVFVDHADQSNARKMEAFAFGRTGALERGEVGPSYPGFVNRGLGYSKTIFIAKRGPHAPQFDNPHYRRLLDLMQQRGVEIGVHSPTGRMDLPAQSRALLTAFRRKYRGRTWVDHQPDTNCEAISNLGWNPRSRWYSLKLLSGAGFKHIWTATDLPLPLGTLNILASKRPWERRPVFYTHSLLGGSSKRPFVLFNTSWQFVERWEFLRRFTIRRINRLERERGLCLAHVYLDSYRNFNGMLPSKSLLSSDGGGGYILRPEVDKLFLRFQRRQARRALWVAGVDRVAGHLRGALATERDFLPGGRVRITNRSRIPLSGLTMMMPLAEAEILIDGRAPLGYFQRRKLIEFYFDLAPGQSRTIEVRDLSGKAVPLLKPAAITLADNPGRAGSPGRLK